MSKQYRIYVRKFKVEPETLDINKLPAGISMTKEKYSVLFEFNNDITDADLQELYKFEKQLILTEKDEYAQLSTNEERISFLAKRQGLE